MNFKKTTIQNGDNTTEEIQGNVIHDGNSIVVVKEEGKNINIMVMPLTGETILDTIKEIAPLFKMILQLFKKAFRKLPTSINYFGNVYNLTIQPAYGTTQDKVFYLIDKEKKGVDKILFKRITEAPTVYSARQKMKNFLREKEILI